MKEEYRKSFFSYWTHAAWSAFMVVLAKHYKYINFKRQLIIDTLNDVKDEIPMDTKFLNQLEKQLEDYTPDEDE